MTVKPVDVFMSGDAGAESCPVSIAAVYSAMLLGVFQEMDDLDLKEWPDISYTGFLGEVGDVRVILDAGPDSILATVDDGDGASWVIELTGEFLDANKS